jgi:ABC-type branched-subunit amino acid transport system substrate-binding protein
VRVSSVARARALVACAFFATVTGAASCARTASTVSVSGRTLTIYISAPGSLAGDPQAQDTVDAERLAYDQLHGQVTSFAVRLREETHGKISDNARAAIEDKTAIAYVGEVEPGATADSVGITNAQDLLQVSPTDTAAELTQRTAADPGAPGRYYEALGTYGRTFARVVPTTLEEARALTAEMQSLAIGALYVASDGSTYGKTIARAVSQDARSGSIHVTEGPADARRFLSSGADAIFLGSRSASASAAATLFGTIVHSSTAKLFAPSALADAAFAGALSPAAARRVYISSPGFMPAALPPVGRTFTTDFRNAYGHAPATEAIFGYEAMSALLGVLRDAGPGANNRTTVLGHFLRLTRTSSQSAIGAYSIDARGDVSIAPFVLNRVKGGSLVPFKAAQG